MHMVLWILASVALLVLAGTVYQHIGSLRDRRIHTGQGRWVSIGRGCGLYFFEEGRGEPTVLFEAGIGATHLNWRGIQDPISTVAHTIAYDRASLGWSSPCRTARTPGNVATELHQMLEADRRLRAYSGVLRAHHVFDALRRGVVSGLLLAALLGCGRRRQLSFSFRPNLGGYSGGGLPPGLGLRLVDDQARTSA